MPIKVSYLLNLNIVNKISLKTFAVRNKYVDMSNTTNQFFTPPKEINYEVYETSFKEYFVPSQQLEPIDKEGLTIFKFSEPIPDKDGFVKLPQFPYEIKEYAFKGFVYTLFLTWGGRFLSGLSIPGNYTIFPFIPFGVFLYQYGNALWLMYNAVTEVRLLGDGKTLRLFFKFRQSVDVSISQLVKKKEENFLNECYSEPMLYPIQINQTEKYGKYSFRSHWTVYLYADSHEAIKYGEILRAAINNQPIQLEAQQQ
jgi:hypothetical protein